MKIGIVGYGTVGKHLERTFANAGFQIYIYDKYKPEYNHPDARKMVNKADRVFVAVPTPSGKNGCDLSAVEEVVEWLEPPICIKSTIVPGTTNRLVTQTGKWIVFSPEYVGETPYHPYRHGVDPDLVVVGGAREAAEQFISLYKQALGPIPHYFITDAVTAELAKYMENCFFATKIVFVAQFFLLAQQFGADFDEMREIWLADSRVGRSHSAVIDSLGFGGRCLPKDLAAVIKAAEEHQGAPFLEGVQKFNDDLHKKDLPTQSVEVHQPVG